MRVNSSSARPGLSFKLLLIVVAVSLIGVLTSSSLVLTLQYQQTVDSAQIAANRLSSAIGASLEHAMLRHDQSTVSQMVQTVAGKEGIQHIRVLDAQGIVQISSESQEVGKRFDYTNPACQFCHTGGARPSNQTAILTSNPNHEVLLNVNLIRNQPQCQSCHDPQNQVLGIMMIEMPLTDLNSQLTAGFWRIALAAFATMGLLVGLMTLALRRLVIRPVSELARGMTEIRAGNLDYAVHSPSHDELGNLAEAFDAMRKRLRFSQSETERRTQELAMLNELALGMSQLLDLQEILELALDTVVNRLGMQAGGIYLFDEETGRFTMRACRGISEEKCREIEKRRQQAGGDVSQQAAQAGQEVLVVRLDADDRLTGFWDQEDKRSYINLPLKSKGAVIGTMGLVTRVDQLLTEREVGVLKAVGHEIGTAIDNALLFAETRRREQETVTLNRLLIKISSSLEMRQVLEAIAEGARQLLDADIGAVGLVDDGQRQISVEACDGNRTDIFRGLTIPIKELVSDSAFSSLKPIYVEEWGSELPIPHVAELIDQEGIVSSLAVPMWFNGRLHGFVGIMTRQHRRFSKQDTQLFVRLVMQVVVAIENADLYKQVRYLATLEERDRLAREMHDNLAQKLGYMNIKASITDDLLSKDQIAQAHSSLLELKQIVKDAYTDVRESIFSLRTTVSSGWGLVPTLRDYLAEYRMHHDIDAQLIVDDERLTRFPAEVEVQVNRIIQEALTNVHKHSGASKAWVRFERDDHHVRVSIEDNGRGFDPADLTEASSRHFGLQIMRERAESVGGELEVYSQNNSGTRVLLRMPIQYADWRSQ